MLRAFKKTIAWSGMVEATVTQVGSDVHTAPSSPAIRSIAPFES